MVNRTELVDVSAYHKIRLNDNGVNYAMKVIWKGDGVYLCEGYALANGVKIAEWFTIVSGLEEATSQETKDYLYRQMKPDAVETLRGLYRVAVMNGVGD
jgi:hypothetical protein